MYIYIIEPTMTQNTKQVLTIHMKRFEKDMTKVDDKYEFPLRLELDEFLAPGASAAAEANFEGEDMYVRLG